PAAGTGARVAAQRRPVAAGHATTRQGIGQEDPQAQDGASPERGRTLAANCGRRRRGDRPRDQRSNFVIVRARHVAPALCGRGTDTAEDHGSWRSSGGSCQGDNIMRGRFPAGPSYVDKLEGSAAAKERLKVVLETLAGQCRVQEACARL